MQYIINVLNYIPDTQMVINNLPEVINKRSKYSYFL